MFEIETSPGRISQRQRNASTKAREESPSYTGLSGDSYEVRSTKYNYGVNSSYTVRFFRSDDKIFATCECDAGQNNFPCYHVMAVYDTHYRNRLVNEAKTLLNRKAAVGGLGFVGTKREPGETVLLSAGQIFEATVPVRLTVERQ